MGRGHRPSLSFVWACSASINTSNWRFFLIVNAFLFFWFINNRSTLIHVYWYWITDIQKFDKNYKFWTWKLNTCFLVQHKKMDNSITISNVKCFILIRSILNLIYSCMHGIFLILLLPSDPKSIVWSSPWLRVVWVCITSNISNQTPIFSNDPFFLFF